jgi:predicted site-specific integrase-resolvase
MAKALIDDADRMLFPFRHAARVVGISRATLRRAADRGELDFVTIAGRPFVPRAEIERLLRERGEK